MTRAVFVLAFLVVSSTDAASAQITKPIQYTWIASSCETWNCAVAALVIANGEPNVIVLPTGQRARPWLILRRVEEGSVFIPEDEPFVCRVFTNVSEASAAFVAMDTCHRPLILNVPDGRAVIASLTKCDGSEKRRSVR